MGRSSAEFTYHREQYVHEGLAIASFKGAWTSVAVGNWILRPPLSRTVGSGIVLARIIWCCTLAAMLLFIALERRDRRTLAERLRLLSSLHPQHGSPESPLRHGMMPSLSGIYAYAVCRAREACTNS